MSKYFSDCRLLSVI